MDIEKEAKVDDRSFVHLHWPSIKSRLFPLMNSILQQAMQLFSIIGRTSALHKLTPVVLMSYIIMLLYLQVMKKLLFQLLFTQSELNSFSFPILSTPVRKRSAACVSQTSQNHQMSTGSTLILWPLYSFTCSLSSLSLPRTRQWPAGCGVKMPLVTQQQLSRQPRGESEDEHWPCCSSSWGSSLSAGSRSTAMWSCCPVTPSRPLTRSTSLSTGWLWAPLATTHLSTAAWIPPSVRSWGSSLTCAGGRGTLWLDWSRRSAPWLLAAPTTGSPGLTTVRAQGQGLLYPIRSTPPHSRVTPLPTSLNTTRTCTCASPPGRCSRAELRSSQWSPPVL